MKAATLTFVLVLTVSLAVFFTWGIGRALDYESRCAQISGQCETP